MCVCAYTRNVWDVGGGDVWGAPINDSEARENSRVHDKLKDVNMSIYFSLARNVFFNGKELKGWIYLFFAFAPYHHYPPRTARRLYAISSETHLPLAVGPGATRVISRFHYCIT